MRQQDHASDDDESREWQGYDCAEGEDVEVAHRLVRDGLQPHARSAGPGGEDDGGINQLARHRAALQKSNAGANDTSEGATRRA